MTEQELSCSSCKKDESPYLVISYYYLMHLENPAQEVKIQKEFLATLDVRSRIYVSNQGVNAQMSALKKDGDIYMQWIASRPLFKGVEFKVQPYSDHAFPRCTVKVRKELAALGCDVSIDERGEYLTPAEWRKTLEDTQDDKVVLDVRNDYEWKLGHFEGAELLSCATFRDFQQSAQELKKRIDPSQTKVLMYCTGGIRCELFSALLKKEGIHNVFQLEGGIIRYGEQEKSKHWLGKLFVFDDRLAVPLSDEEAPAIGRCHHCGNTSEAYYNCANMDCNELFLCCPECVEQFHGCCQFSCQHAKRVRPHMYSGKPFRKWYNYACAKEAPSTSICLQGE